MGSFFRRRGSKQLKKLKLHVIEEKDPTRVLTTCFAPLFAIMVHVGILPLNVHKNGWASFKILQYQFVFYVFFVGTFIFLTYVYAPFYVGAMNEMGAAFVFEVAKYLFVCGQHLAAAMTILMVPFLTGRVAKLWNKLNQLVLQITLCYSAHCFIRVYRLARLIILLWLLVVVSSWYLWWKSFFLEELFQKYLKTGHGSFTFYIHVVGCISMSTLISAHVLHSIFFITLACTLRMCFRSITHAATAGGIGRFQISSSQQLVVSEHQLSEKAVERKTVCCQLLEAYRRTRELVVFLGNIYGRYMVVEMFAFFSATLTSIFALFDNFQAIRLETVIITLLINTAWFCGMCECGQMLLNEERKCFLSLKGIALRSGMPSNWMIEKFMGVKSIGLTAADYFTFSRKLVTAAVVSLVTYLIVMLQFSSADKTHSLIRDIKINMTCRN